MMMAALVCFFGKNNALQPFPVYYFFVILVSFAFSRSVGSVSSFNRLQLVLLLVLLFTANI